jgi:hypothetical protein
MQKQLISSACTIPPLACKADTVGCKRKKEGLAPGPLIELAGLECRGKQKKIGGLGSSHTAPCGAAVPARPPTRSSETTHLHCAPQWVRRATGRGTRVVVQTAIFSGQPRNQRTSKPFNYCKLRTRRPANSSAATPNSTTPVPAIFHLLGHRTPPPVFRKMRHINSRSQAFVHQKSPKIAFDFT